MSMSDGIAPDSIELFRIQPRTAGALYEQLAQRIAAAITSNKLQPGAALPSERMLSERLQVSRTTVRKALDELIEHGLVTSHHGSGNFVATPRLEQPLAGLSSFSDDMRARGRRPGFVWIERGVFTPSPEEIIALQLSSSEKVSRFVRVRLADDEPLAIERAAIAHRYLPDPDVVEGSLYAALSARGLNPTRALQHLRAESGDYRRCATPRHPGRQPGHGYCPLWLSRRRTANRVYPFGLSRRSL